MFAWNCCPGLTPDGTTTFTGPDADCTTIVVPGAASGGTVTINVSIARCCRWRPCASYPPLRLDALRAAQQRLEVDHHRGSVSPVVVTTG
jgi:hypothetical protein